MVRYMFFGTKVISRLIGLIYENKAKMANKILVASNPKCVHKKSKQQTYTQKGGTNSNTSRMVVRKPVTEV